MDQIGIVKEINEEKAIITIRRPSACGENCAGCTLSCDVSEVDVTIDKIDGIEVGDSVEITSDNVNVLKLSFILYGVPLVIFVMFIAIANAILGGEKQLISGLIGIASLVISSFILRAYENKETKRNGPVFTILGKIEEEDENE